MLLWSTPAAAGTVATVPNITTTRGVHVALGRVAAADTSRVQSPGICPHGGVSEVNVHNVIEQTFRHFTGVQLTVGRSMLAEKSTNRQCLPTNCQLDSAHSFSWIFSSIGDYPQQASVARTATTAPNHPTGLAPAGLSRPWSRRCGWRSSRWSSSSSRWSTHWPDWPGWSSPRSSCCELLPTAAVGISNKDCSCKP